MPYSEIALRAAGTEHIRFTYKRAKTVDDDGYGIPETDATRTVEAHIQPANHRQKQALPEGLRDEESVLVAALSPFLEGDEFVWNGKRYRIHGVKDWTRLKLWKGMAVRINE